MQESSTVVHLPRTILGDPAPAQPPPQDRAGMLTDRDLEREYGLKRKTWQTMRSTRRGPPYYKLGDRCLYRRDEVETWLASHRVETSFR